MDNDYKVVKSCVNVCWRDNVFQHEPKKVLEIFARYPHGDELEWELDRYDRFRWTVIYLMRKKNIHPTDATIATAWVEAKCNFPPFANLSNFSIDDQLVIINTIVAAITHSTPVGKALDFSYRSEPCIWGGAANTFIDFSTELKLDKYSVYEHSDTLSVISNLLLCMSSCLGDYYTQLYDEDRYDDSDYDDFDDGSTDYGSENENFKDFEIKNDPDTLVDLACEVCSKTMIKSKLEDILPPSILGTI